MLKIIITDNKRCVACKTCELECAMAHGEFDTLAEAAAAGTPPQRRIRIEQRKGRAVIVLCRHCKPAPCIEACPQDAITRADADSPVVLDEELCVGCGACVEVCPFGGIEMSTDGKVAMKCDLCAARTVKGELPACVAGCPTQALEYRAPGKKVKK